MCASAYVQQRALADGEAQPMSCMGPEIHGGGGVVMEGRGKQVTDPGDLARALDRVGVQLLHAGGALPPGAGAAVAAQDLQTVLQAIGAGEGGCTVTSHQRARVGVRAYRSHRLDDSYTTTTAAVLARHGDEEFPAWVEQFLEVRTADGHGVVHVAEVLPHEGAAPHPSTGLLTAAGEPAGELRYVLCANLAPLFYARYAGGAGDPTRYTYFRYNTRGADPWADAGEERDAAEDAWGPESLTADG